MTTTTRTRKRVPTLAKTALVAAMAALGILFTGTAHADPYGIDPGTVCTLARMGISPAQIAQNLHNGTNIPTQTAIGIVWDDLRNCS